MPCSGMKTAFLIEAQTEDGQWLARTDWSVFTTESKARAKISRVVELNQQQMLRTMRNLKSVKRGHGAAEWEKLAFDIVDYPHKFRVVRIGMD